MQYFLKMLAERAGKDILSCQAIDENVSRIAL